MRQLRPPRGAGAELAERLAEDRQLMREVKPQLRALYEGRPATEDERRQSCRAADRRLDQLGLPAASAGCWARLAEVVPLPPDAA